MQKGYATRQAILDGAIQVASREGLAGLSIGPLAVQLQMSKSGLFAHFRSKEQLQLQTLSHARERFVQVVVRPAWELPRGESRVRALFDYWQRWDHSGLSGGCIFVAAAVELDDRPGALRDALVQYEWEWLELLTSVTRDAIATGDFRTNLDPAQFGFELHGLMLSHHYLSRLILDDASADQRTATALNRLLQDAYMSPPDDTEGLRCLSHNQKGRTCVQS
jgi:AcrR family transcriptional regulator